MKLKLLYFLLLPMLFLLSCASSLRFDQTCLTCVQSQRFSCAENDCPKTFMVGSECLVTIVETGENIFLNSILEEEGIAPAENIPVAIAKLNGYIYLTGNGFGKLWRLCPKINNEAKYKAIKLPVENTKISGPVFSLNLEDFLLKLTADNYNDKTYILENGEWSIVGGGKAGE